MDPGQVLSDGFILKYTSAGLLVISSRCNFVSHATGSKTFRKWLWNQGNKEKERSPSNVGLETQHTGYSLCNLTLFNPVTVTCVFAQGSKVTWVFKLFTLLGLEVLRNIRVAQIDSAWGDEERSCGMHWSRRKMKTLRRDTHGSKASK